MCAGTRSAGTASPAPGRCRHASSSVCSSRVPAASVARVVRGRHRVQVRDAVEAGAGVLVGGHPAQRAEQVAERQVPARGEQRSRARAWCVMRSSWVSRPPGVVRRHAETAARRRPSCVRDVRSRGVRLGGGPPQVHVRAHRAMVAGRRPESTGPPERIKRLGRGDGRRSADRQPTAEERRRPTTRRRSARSGASAQAAAPARTPRGSAGAGEAEVDLRLGRVRPARRDHLAARVEVIPSGPYMWVSPNSEAFQPPKE